GPLTVATNTWYQVDISCDSSGGQTIVRGSIDQGGIVTVQRTQATSAITRQALGTSQTDTYTAYYDDWDVGIDLADFPRGGHHVESLIVNGDGTHNIATSGDFDSFTTIPFSNATTAANTFIDHR